MANILKDFSFGNEAGDDVDSTELLSYFVVKDGFNRYLSEDEKILVSTAKKGAGKSALLKWIGCEIETRDPISLVVSCRGAELSRKRFKIDSKPELPNDYIQDWMVRICTLINRALGVKIGFASNDDEISLVEAAEIEGFKRRNIISCLLDRFKNPLAMAAPDKVGSSNEIELLKRVDKDKVWFVVDDLDATFQRTEGELLELSTFFTACRYLVRDVKGLRFRISMRTDVWPMIRRYDEALDKMEQYVQEIRWKQADFRKLLEARINSYFCRKNIKFNCSGNLNEEERQERIINKIFVPKMEWGDKDVFTYKVIYTLSYHRPRWAIQLCKLAQQNAIASTSTLIRKDDIDNVWGEYGKKRISDIVSEHKHQCKDVEELINAFRGAERRMSREQLLSWIKTRISTHITTVIDGDIASSPLDIARFLYRIGFIVARSDGENEYEHFHYDEMPDFLSSRTSDDFSVMWEIHPCYREALDITKVRRSHRIQRGYIKK